MELTDKFKDGDLEEIEGKIDASNSIQKQIFYL